MWELAYELWALHPPQLGMLTHNTSEEPLLFALVVEVLEGHLFEAKHLQLVELN
jgi:hypothetical protein